MKDNELIIIGLASLYALQTQDTAGAVIARWKEMEINLFPKSKRAITAKVDENAVAEVYKAYPPYDSLNNNRSTSKGATSKNLIRHLLATGTTKEELLEVIKEKVNSTSYLPNFNTFLRNLPCKEDYVKTTPKNDSFHF